MSISNVQAHNYDYYSITKKVNQSGENTFSQSRGVDTVSISDEARSKINSSSEQTAAKSERKAPDTKASMLSLMMESLLMAMLGENEDNAPKPNNDVNSEQGSEQNNAQQSGEAQTTMTKNAGQDKSSGVAQEGEAVTGIKNAINDFMFGGGGMSAVSSAMNSTTNTSSTNVSANYSKDATSKMK